MSRQGMEMEYIKESTVTESQSTQQKCKEDVKTVCVCVCVCVCATKGTGCLKMLYFILEDHLFQNNPLL